MILIEKAARRLTLINDETGKSLFSCSISLGFNPNGPKTREGDGRTPEGCYRVVTINRQSRFHTALGLSYPSPADVRRARREIAVSPLTRLRIRAAALLGLRPPWKTPLGGFVMIHGEHPEPKTGDWTAGCIALSNENIDRLAALVRKGEPVRITA